MENLEICSKCKGKCCKAMGCHFSPDDFKDLSYEGLKKEMDKGYISIDWWEGNPFDPDKRNEIPRAFFLRVRNRDAKIVDASWGGACSLLSEKGCTLSYEERPKGGKELIPAVPKCIIKYSKDECAKEWYKYDDILRKLEDYYCNKDIKNKYQTDYDPNGSFNNTVPDEYFDEAKEKVMKVVIDHFKNLR